MKGLIAFPLFLIFLIVIPSALYAQNDTTLASLTPMLNSNDYSIRSRAATMIKLYLGVIIPIFIALLLMPGICRSENPAALCIDSMLQAKDAGLRYWAAQRLSAPNGLDTVTAVHKLIQALDKEIKSPFSNAKIQHGMTTITENLKLNYTTALSSLWPKIQEIIPPMLDSTRGEFKDWLAISLAFKGYPEVHNLLKSIIVSSPNAYVRRYAVRSPEKYSDSNDIPLLEDALNDTSWVFKLGVDTIRRGWEYEVIEKK
jgi:hypothetical protein